MTEEGRPEGKLARELEGQIRSDLLNLVRRLEDFADPTDFSVPKLWSTVMAANRDVQSRISLPDRAVIDGGELIQAIEALRSAEAQSRADSRTESPQREWLVGLAQSTSVELRSLSHRWRGWYARYRQPPSRALLYVVPFALVALGIVLVTYPAGVYAVAVATWIVAALALLDRFGVWIVRSNA